MTDDNLHHLPRISMGEAISMYGLTARAIRFYEEKGLIEPRRDRNNVRFFDAVARRRLVWIAQFRKAGVSLQEIGAILQLEESSSRRRERAIASLESRRQALQEELEQVQATQAQFELHLPQQVGQQCR